MGKKSKLQKEKKVEKQADSKKIKKTEKEGNGHVASNSKKTDAKPIKSSNGNKQQEVAVIGGGLIGLGLSIMLARKGVKVVVYEKRKSVLPTPGRVTNIYLSYRGITALNEMGLSPYDMKGWSLINGLTLHNAQGVTIPIPFPGQGFMINIDRQKVFEYMLEEAKKEKNIKIHFATEIKKVDFEKGSLMFENAMHSYDWIFACDGSNSLMRQALAEQKGFTYTKEPAGAAIEFILRKPGLNKNHITFYYGKSTYLSCALSSRQDGTHDCQFMCEPDWFKSLTSKQRKEFIDNEYPDWKDFMEIKDETKVNEIYFQNIIPWYKGKVCLLGDAAYSQPPNIGSGLNLSLQMISKFRKHIEKDGLDWPGICKKIFDELQPESRAVARLVAFNKNNVLKTLDKPALQRAQIGKYLGINYKERYIMGVDALQFCNLPYSGAEKYLNIDKQIIDDILALKDWEDIVKAGGQNKAVTKILDKYQGQLDPFLAIIRERTDIRPKNFQDLLFKD